MAAIRVLGGGGGGASVLDLGVTMTMTADNDLTAVFQSAPDEEAMRNASAVSLVVDISAWQSGMAVTEKLAVITAMTVGSAGTLISVGGDSGEMPSFFIFQFEGGTLSAISAKVSGGIVNVPFTIAGENGGVE